MITICVFGLRYEECRGDLLVEAGITPVICSVGNKI
jgi:hypothetical protein